MTCDKAEQHICDFFKWNILYSYYYEFCKRRIHSTVMLVMSITGIFDDMQTFG